MKKGKQKEGVRGGGKVPKLNVTITSFRFQSKNFTFKYICTYFHAALDREDNACVLH